MNTTDTRTVSFTGLIRLKLQVVNGWSLSLLFIAFLVAIPVLVVFGFVFVPTGEVWSHLVETVLSTYVLNSLWLMLGVGSGTLIIGTGTAWLVTMCRFPGHRILNWALLLPLAVPAYVIAYTYTGLLDYAGPVQSELRELFDWTTSRDYWFPAVRSLGGAIAMMSLVLYPYVYMLARAAFLEQSVCVLEASRTLGKTPFQSFRFVALPLARPAIAAGLALALMETLNDFGTVHFFAIDTFTTGIYRTWLGLGEPAAAAQLGACLMIFITALVMLERHSRGRAKFHHTTSKYRRIKKFELRGLRGGFALLACFLPVFLGFLLPAAILLGWTIETPEEWMNAAFWGLAWNSFVLAASASILAVCVALFLSYGVRLHPTWLNRTAVRAASLGYAVPGTVIAVGIMLPFAWLDNQIDAWMRSIFGISTGLLLTGTIAAVVFGYLVRFLSVSFNTVEAALGKVTPSMDAAARTLGVPPGKTLLKVHLPIIRGSLLTAGVLVFVDVMKELPATMIMRPFNFTTLAVRTFELATDEQLAEASSAALAIVLVGIVPVILINLAIARSRPGEE
ncbi:MAG: iron ABC transporter permease [Rhodospirillales bacterium]|nr:iron ABC transporter permease [Rhodospirillales bacterium]